MEARIILREEKNRQHLINRLNEIRLDPEQPLEVNIKPYKKNRSLEQNNLYWPWVTIIGNELGYTKEDMHEVLMRKFLTPHIVEIDGVQIETYSTKRLKVKEMSEYLQHIDVFAAELGVVLPHPDQRGM